MKEKTQYSIGTSKSHKKLIANIRAISKYIMNVSYATCKEDDRSTVLLKKLNSKECDAINTFIKIANLLLKVMPVESKLEGQNYDEKPNASLEELNNLFHDFSKIISSDKEKNNNHDANSTS